MKNIEELTIAASQSFKEREYWLRKLAGELPTSNFPYDTKSRGTAERQMDSVRFAFSEKCFLRLMKLSNHSFSRLHMILTAGITALLDKYTGNRDIIIGIPVVKQEIEADFVNTVLTLRNILQDNTTFKDLILQVRKNIVEATENQNYPIETLMYDLGCSENEKNIPLFDVAVLLENIHDIKYIQHVDFNVIFSFLEKEDSLAGCLQYNSLLYGEATATRMIDHFSRLMEKVLFAVDLELQELELLSDQEKKQILFDFNEQRDTAYPREKTINELFEDQVWETPDNIAIVGPGTSTWRTLSITYKELREQVNRLSCAIKARGVKPETFVGIIAERSLEMVIGMLAVMKVGGAYLPVDPEYPVERIKYMLEDSGVKLVLSNIESKNWQEYKGDFIDLNSCGSFHDEGREPGIIPANHNSAYIIYTSGSSGSPKGVVVEHTAIVNTLYWRKNYYGFDQKDAVLQIPSFSFDSSVEDIFTPLISGARLILINEAKRLELDYLCELIENNVVTHFLAIPHFYRTFLEEMPEKLRMLKIITLAGDNFSKELVQEHFEKLPDTRLFNEYGPTENSVCTTVYEFRPGSSRVLIGKPISNVSCYILDSDMKLCPLGVPGELCVSGSGLSRGYFRRPKLTEEKFVANPYMPGEQMYKTGDLARWLPDGNIEFFGRIDHQVKIRGIRIELGEIESHLLKQKDIKEAVVVAKDDKKGDKYLCAYLVMNDPGKEYDVSKIADSLNVHIPEYILPSYYLKLEELPLTPNGKIDRNKLPDPDGVLSVGVDYVDPRSELEEKLAVIWKSELGLERVSMKDNYFNIGGDSIKSIRLISIINKELNKKLKIADLYINNTIEKLAKVVDEKEVETSTPEYKKVVDKIEKIKNKYIGEGIPGG